MTVTISNTTLSFPGNFVNHENNGLYQFKEDVKGMWLRESGDTTYIYTEIEDFYTPQRKEEYNYYLIVDHDIQDKYYATYVPSSHKEYTEHVPDMWLFTSKDFRTYARKSLIIRLPKQMKKGVCFAINENTWFFKEPGKDATPCLIKRGDYIYGKIGLGGRTKYI